jgi:uncharacterized membrane protein (DUF4010 family)
MDPFGALNPHEIWLFAIIIAAISYGGYVALKLFPPHHGIALAAATGAVVSSTSVTLDLARRSRTSGAVRSLAGGACLAAAVSALRVVLVVAILRQPLAVHVAPAALGGALFFGLAGVGLLRRSGQTSEAEVAPGNPFVLQAVLGFAAVLAAVSLAAQASLRWFGSGGLFATAAIGSIADVDAAVLAALRLPATVATEATAAQAVLLAIAISAVARVVYAFALGGRKFASFFGAATLGALAVGAAVHLAASL